MSLASNAPSATKPRRRRTPRPINSCTECRLRKSRCSRSYPCQNCTTFERECIFIDSLQSRKPVGHKPEAHARSPARAENLLENAQTPPRDFEWEDYLQERSPENDPWDELVVDPVALHDGTYLDEDDDGMVEIGATSRTLRIGKMVITERVGGLIQPGTVKEIESLLSADRTLQRPNMGSFADYCTKTSIVGIDLFANSNNSAGSEVILPYRFEAELLYQQYLQAVDPIAHILHIPSFKRMFDSFWDNVDEQRPNSGPRTALVLGMCMSAAASMSSLQTMSHFGVSQDSLYAHLKMSSEAAFKKWNCLTSSSIQSLQALTIYLITECRSEVTRAHSVLVGALIRLAQCVGIHRNNMIKTLDPRQRHVRSLLWYHICYLDVRTAEAEGNQPSIRPDDFDIPIPSNVDDTSLDFVLAPPQPITGWTDTTFALLRFEFTELYAIILRGRVQIDRGQITLRELRHAVASKKAFIRDRYVAHLNTSVPIQRYAHLVANLMLSRCDIMILYRYFPKKERTPAQDRLIDIIIESALTTSESGAALETSASSQQFAWYAGAYQQYQSVLLLLIERYKNPKLKHSDRIQRLTDYIFGPCYGVDLTHRCGQLLWRVKEGLESLYQVQKIPTPNKPGSAMRNNQNLDEVLHPDGFDVQMKLSDVELEDLFNSFQGGSSSAQAPFQPVSGNEPWANHLAMDNSLLLGHEDRGDPFGVGMSDMSYLQ